jgi:hypothetical protein
MLASVEWVPLDELKPTLSLTRFNERLGDFALVDETTARTSDKRVSRY